MLQARERDFAEALRAAVEARGLSLDRVRAHLLSYGHNVSVATLSYWQTGRSMPVRRSSLQALGALEVILQVPRGSLAARLPSQQGRRSATDPTDVRLGIEAGDRIARDFGLSWNDGFHPVSQEERIGLGSDRSLTHHSRSDLIVAERDGFGRLLVGYRTQVPGILFEVLAGRGCHVGRVATALPDTLTVAELVLDQPLRAGEPYVVEHGTSLDLPGDCCQDWHRVHLQPTRSTTVLVSFAPDDLPHTLERYVGPQTDDPTYAPCSLMGNEMMVHEEDFGPGQIAVRWSWEDEDEALRGA